jgi:hypothetical protein
MTPNEILNYKLKEKKSRNTSEIIVAFCFATTITSLNRPNGGGGDCDEDNENDDTHMTTWRFHKIERQPVDK